MYLVCCELGHTLEPIGVDDPNHFWELKASTLIWLWLPMMMAGGGWTHFQRYSIFSSQRKRSCIKSNPHCCRITKALYKKLSSPHWHLCRCRWMMLRNHLQNAPSCWRRHVPCLCSCIGYCNDDENGRYILLTQPQQRILWLLSSFVISATSRARRGGGGAFGADSTLAVAFTIITALPPALSLIQQRKRHWRPSPPLPWNSLPLLGNNNNNRHCCYQQE